MPLLCISLLALLLLPLPLSLSLSCDSKSLPAEVRNHYMAIVQTDLDNTRGSIATLLQNSSCSELKHRLQRCTSDNTDVVSTLHLLTCKMKNLRLHHTEGLVKSVLNSIHCPCPETKEPNVSLKRRTATRKRRNEQKKSRREQKLCKAKAILSAMTGCYEMLNTVT